MLQFCTDVDVEWPREFEFGNGGGRNNQVIESSYDFLEFFFFFFGGRKEGIWQ